MNHALQAEALWFLGPLGSIWQWAHLNEITFWVAGLCQLPSLIRTLGIILTFPLKLTSVTVSMPPTKAQNTKDPGWKAPSDSKSLFSDQTVKSLSLNLLSLDFVFIITIKGGTATVSGSPVHYGTVLAQIAFWGNCIGFCGGSHWASLWSRPRSELPQQSFNVSWCPKVPLIKMVMHQIVNFFS